MAIAEGTGLLVRSIVATANATINPPTSISATPLLFRFSVTSASFHAGFRCSSPEQTKVIRIRTSMAPMTSPTDQTTMGLDFEFGETADLRCPAVMASTSTFPERRL